VTRKTGKQAFIDWTTEKTKNLLEASKSLIPISDVHYPGHTWSIVKLLILSGWVYVYTTIIPKHYKEYWYIDLLAGSGTTYVKETGDVVIGSPFIAHFFAYNQFTKYIYFEKNRRRYEALRRRASKLMGSKAVVINEDCNEAIREALPAKRNVHSLVFIDNEGFDVYWSTISTLLGYNTDILIVFPTSSSVRPKSGLEKLKLFYRDLSWLRAQDKEEFLEAYMQQLGEEYRRLRRKEEYVSNIRVGSRQFYYDVILVCKKGPYIRAWEYFKGRLDWQNPAIIETTLDILHGRATRIDWFIGLQEEIASINRKMERKTQKSLEEFII